MFNFPLTVNYRHGNGCPPHGTVGVTSPVRCPPLLSTRCPPSTPLRGVGAATYDRRAGQHQHIPPAPSTRGPRCCRRRPLIRPVHQSDGRAPCQLTAGSADDRRGRHASGAGAEVTRRRRTDCVSQRENRSALALHGMPRGMGCSGHHDRVLPQRGGGAPAVLRRRSLPGQAEEMPAGDGPIRMMRRGLGRKRLGS